MQLLIHFVGSANQPTNTFAVADRCQSTSKHTQTGAQCSLQVTMCSLWSNTAMFIPCLHHLRAHQMETHLPMPFDCTFVRDSDGSMHRPT